MRKCPGVNASTPSSSQDKGANGLLLRQASICSKTVANSSNVNLMSATIYTLQVGLNYRMYNYYYLSYLKG